jgi:hypothetical protein
MKQLSKEEAITLHTSEVWKSWSKEDIAAFQLFQKRLCVPFDIFHEAIEEVLDRPVYIHEFAFVEELKKEYINKGPMPSFEHIIGLLPKNKTILIID